MPFFLFCITEEKNIEHYFLHVLRMNGQGCLFYFIAEYAPFFLFCITEEKNIEHYFYMC